mmetsp:Transcript_55217/g.128817  ORF Transcript_55217/g.128817 Transcript_55217/m.128817 type:complete len:242 (+) Transcript_55217:194-919(+)
MAALSALQAFFSTVNTSMAHLTITSAVPLSPRRSAERLCVAATAIQYLYVVLELCVLEVWLSSHDQIQSTLRISLHTHPDAIHPGGASFKARRPHLVGSDSPDFWRGRDALVAPGPKKAAEPTQEHHENDQRDDDSCPSTRYPPQECKQIKAIRFGKGALRFCSWRRRLLQGRPERSNRFRSLEVCHLGQSHAKAQEVSLFLDHVPTRAFARTEWYQAQDELSPHRRLGPDEDNKGLVRQL